MSVASRQYKIVFELRLPQRESLRQFGFRSGDVGEAAGKHRTKVGKVHNNETARSRSYK